MKSIALLLLLLLASSCSPAPAGRIGVLHVGEDPTKVLLVHGRRLTGDVPVSYRDGAMVLADIRMPSDTGHPVTRRFVGFELDALKRAFEWEGPTLVYFTGPAPDRLPERHMVGREVALKGIAEIEAIERHAAQSPDSIPAPGEDAVLTAAARNEVAAYTRANGR